MQLKYLVLVAHVRVEPLNLFSWRVTTSELWGFFSSSDCGLQGFKTEITLKPLRGRMAELSVVLVSQQVFAQYGIESYNVKYCISSKETW